MPAQRPRAAFEPIPPDLDVAALVESAPNLEYVVRIHCNSIDEHGLDNFDKLVRLHVILGGKPLVIEGFHERLDRSVFSEKWLRSHHSTKRKSTSLVTLCLAPNEFLLISKSHFKEEIARNLTTKSNLPLSIGHYLKNMPLLTNEWNSFNYKNSDRQRIYLKDIDCPQTWHDHLKNLIPPPLFYLNKHPEAFQGPGGESVTATEGHQSQAKPERKVGKPSDLMSCLPASMRAENLMCYIGHEGTYTPAHYEMCASLGQNIMVEASDGSVEYGMKTMPGSSIWFMTESKDRRVVSEYWQSTLGHDIDIEDHFAQINAWKAAPFRTYIVEQRPGDFILIPPLAAHQVWNRGTRTMKVAWNRTTVETLSLALSEALPHARMVCRDEQYKNKAIVFYSLEHYSKLLEKVDAKSMDSKQQQLLKDFEHLFALYTQVLLSESFSQDKGEEKNVEYIPFDSNITCSYCRCNIFNRFLTCPWCAGGQTADGEDPYDICMECYVMGRSCACLSRLKWAEQFPWSELTGKYETWRDQICRLNKSNLNDQIFWPLAEERARYGKKTLAEMCQEELKRRPWVDITKPVTRKIEDNLSDSESPARKRRKTKLSHESEEGGRCHICKYIEPIWKLASCDYCNQNYCYGSLFRAFNIQPQETMAVYRWMCPRCQKICSCAACRRDPSMKPFEPTCTLLGHDTRKIADPRSVESLVDFRQSNLRWLKKAGDDEIERLKKHQKEADEKRQQAMIEYHIQLEGSPRVSAPATDYGDIPVDPALEKLSGSILTPPDSITP